MLFASHSIVLLHHYLDKLVHTCDTIIMNLFIATSIALLRHYIDRLVHMCATSTTMSTTLDQMPQTHINHVT